MEKKEIVTIDGPAGVGKSTVAKALAKRLNYKHINTGYIYRSIAYKVLKQGIDIKEEDKIVELVKNTTIDFEMKNSEARIIVDGKDLTDEIASPGIVNFTSKVASISEVRRTLLTIQRKLGEKGKVVIEGRDVGTVIFSDAKWKFYIDADIRKRAERLMKIMSEEDKKKYHDIESVIPYLKDWDERDKSRKVGPLKKADDAIVYDNEYSPDPEQDAIVLEYYITHKDEIIKNSKELKRK